MGPICGAPRVLPPNLTCVSSLLTLLSPLLASLFFSLVPALQFWRPDVTQALKQQAAAIAGGPHRLRRASVVAQIGLGLLLLVGAGLFCAHAA